jgi:hypothetical protein
MKFKNIIETLLVEASKKDILINKMGVNEYNANALSEVAGPLSVFFTYKILEKYEKDSQNAISKDIKERMGLVNGSNSFVREREKLRGIMDWVRVGLAGNINPYKELTYSELHDESERWHESLNIGESKIDYKEDNEIIIDFRQNGQGYYWADLGATNCPDEAERMGHCASSRGVLYSLRSYKKIENNHTLNKSHLTASINHGDLLQLKGAKNSKPDEGYHKYILALINHKVNQDDYLIDAFGYEYDSENDFKIADLNEEQIKDLYQTRPELFNKKSLKRLLYSMGILEKPPKGSDTIIIDVSAKYVEDYLDMDRNLRSGLVADILSGDAYNLYDNYDSNSWKTAVDYHIDEENEKIIRNFLDNFSRENGIENNDIFDSDLEEVIEEYDTDDIVKDIINGAVSNAESDSYFDYLYTRLKNALSELGNIISLSDEGLKIEIDLGEIERGVNDETLDKMYNDCNDDPECVFEELKAYSWVDLPQFYLDDRYYPDINNSDFNDLLKDRLNEI